MKKTLGIISGSSFYSFEEIKGFETKKFNTAFGEQEVLMGEISGRPVAWIPRHGIKKDRLAPVLNPRAIISAMKEIGVVGIVGDSVTGLIDIKIPLGEPILFDDLYFPQNRLPDGSLCTFFNKIGQGQAHLVFNDPLSPGLRKIVKKAADEAGIWIVNGGIYAHSSGPRFETRTEIRHLQLLGCTAVSMTSASEAFLAAEMEIPYVLIGFGINFATGLKAKSASHQEIKDNLEKVPKRLKPIIRTLAKMNDLDSLDFDTGYIH
ncbi:MAG: MTAP family purine nucleoside phosphorylase [Candidatus Eremiobacteraeota bacterium]|nr:MTAP family purine nucleoside phosphorylase [Candidatus Eremiobacteraeota bacterium]